MYYVQPIVWTCVLFLAVMLWTVSRTVGCPSEVTPSDCQVLTWTRVCTAPAQLPPPLVCLVSTCTVISKPILTTSTSVGKHCNQICYRTWSVICIMSSVNNQNETGPMKTLFYYVNKVNIRKVYLEDQILFHESIFLYFFFLWYYTGNIKRYRNW